MAQYVSSLSPHPSRQWCVLELIPSHHPFAANLTAGALLVDLTRPPKDAPEAEMATSSTGTETSAPPHPAFSGRPMPGSFPGVYLHPSTGTPASLAQAGQIDTPAPLPEPTGPLYAIPGMAYGTGAGSMGVLRGNWRGRVGLAGARRGLGRGAGGGTTDEPPFQGSSEGL